MTRYVPSRNYLVLGVVALASAGLSAWVASRWPLAGLPCILLLAISGLNFFLALRPTVEVGPKTIVVGDREYLWSEVASIQRTGWVSPLVVWLALEDGRRILIIYPGALEGSRRLAEDMSRRLSRAQEAVSARSLVAAASGQGRAAQTPQRKQAPLLRADDEAEIERMFARLKSAGSIDE